MQQDLVINNVTVAAGENIDIRLSVGQLATGTKIYIYANVFRGVKKGPTILLLGGVHGDEINGIEIVRRSIKQGYFDSLNSGTVIAISLLNIYGFINFSRDIPYGKDVNRSFPGNMKGSLASRVARVLTRKIIPHVDYILDFHTGGANRYNHPQIRFTAGITKTKTLAKKFGAPASIMKPVIAKSLRKIARDSKILTLVFEGGESSRFDGYTIDVAQRGIRNIMTHLKIKSFEFSESSTQFFSKSIWQRAQEAGIFEWTKTSGYWVKKGEPVGKINDPFGLKEQINILASKSGFIIGHNNAPVVRQGDPLFHIAYNE